jgi:glyoxylase-like metal-dependent hydrolase (beta-lactamase superfamily II)
MIELYPGLWQIGIDIPGCESAASYLIGGPREWALVDAGGLGHYDELKHELGQRGIEPKDIQALYLTHPHSDHYEGGVLLRQESDADVYVGAQGVGVLAKGDYWRTAGFYYGRRPLPLTGAEPIGNGYERRFGNVVISALETPGHSPDSISYELNFRHSLVRIGLLGDTAWGGWHGLIGSDFSDWDDSVGLLRSRAFTAVSFGHDTMKLISHNGSAEPHLARLAANIGNYLNSYDDIPEEYFDIDKASPAVMPDLSTEAA